MAALAFTLGACTGTVRVEPPQPDDTAIERPPEVAPPERTTLPPEAAPDTTQPESVAPAPRVRSPEEALIHFGRLYLDLSPEARRQEYTQSEERYLQDTSPRNLVRYALLAALNGIERPGTGQRLRTDLRAHIAEANGADGAENLVPLARVLLHILEERDQLLRQLNARNEDLQRKLEELKDIERQLRDRTGPETEPIQPLQSP